MNHSITWRGAARLVAVAALVLFTVLLMAVQPALAAPAIPDSATEIAQPPEPPEPPEPELNPDIEPGPGDITSKPPCPTHGDCNPDNEPGGFTTCPEDQDCTPEQDPCQVNPEDCDNSGEPGSEIPVPTRIDTGAGGTASASNTFSALATAVALLGFGAALARRAITRSLRGQR